MDIVKRLRTEPPTYQLIGDAAIEIERLREALQEILKTNHMDYVLMKEIARAALKEKE